MFHSTFLNKSMHLFPTFFTKYKERLLHSTWSECSLTRSPTTSSSIDHLLLASLPHCAGRTQSFQSHPSSVTSAVPQGSVLGPLLFITDLLPLTNIFHKFRIHFHRLADDIYCIWNICHLLPSLSLHSTSILVHSLGASRIDYCNSLLLGLSHESLQKFKMVQNSTTCIITEIPYFFPHFQVLQLFHWLPIKFRVYFKINFCTHWWSSTTLIH